MLLRGVVSAALVAGGLGLLPAAAIAQSEPAAPVADPAAAAVQPAEPAEPAAATEAEPACAPQEDDKLTPAEPTPDPATAQAAAGGVEAHCSQNAGDQQYQDPFAGSEPPGGGNGGSSQGADESSSQSTDTTSSSEVVSQGTVAGQDTGATADPAGPSLPNTGLGLGGLVALGLPLLAGGIALRLRLA